MATCFNAYFNDVTHRILCIYTLRPEDHKWRRPAANSELLQRENVAVSEVSERHRQHVHCDANNSTTHRLIRRTHRSMHATPTAAAWELATGSAISDDDVTGSSRARHDVIGGRRLVTLSRALLPTQTHHFIHCAACRCRLRVKLHLTHKPTNIRLSNCPLSVAGVHPMGRRGRRCFKKFKRVELIAGIIHEIWSVENQENHQNYCHQMSNFKGTQFDSWCQSVRPFAS